MVCDGGVVTKLPPPIDFTASDSASLSALRSEIYKDAIDKGCYIIALDKYSDDTNQITLHTIVERIERSRERSNDDR